MKKKMPQVTLQKLIKELADLKFALDAASIVAITDKNGRITYANDKFCEISQYSQEELVGQGHQIVNSGYHSKDFFRGLWRTISRGKVWKGEIRNRKKDGMFYWVDTTIVPFLNDKGKPYQYIAIRNDITRRKRMEEDFKVLSQKIIQAQESERDRIAREIHDDLGQSLVTLKMLIQSTLNLAKPNKSSLTAPHKKIINYLDVIIEKSRHLAYGLRPATLEILGLSTALQTLIHDFRLKKGLEIKFHCVNLDRFVFHGGGINFYRIIQEALNNVVTHSKATRVDIAIKLSKGQLVTTIRDNGVGFNAAPKEPAKRSHRGIGLSTMEERAKLMSGEFMIDSQPGKGTLVTLTIPVSSNAVRQPLGSKMGKVYPISADLRGRM